LTILKRAPCRRMGLLRGRHNTRLKRNVSGRDAARRPLSRPVGLRTMTDVADAARKHLDLLTGLRLSASYRAVDMRMFHFGTMRTVEGGAVGEYALHVQCPWRIETADQIVTGRHDLFKPAEETEDFDWDSWDWDGNETLQDKLVAEFLTHVCPVVESVATDAHGGARLQLSRGYSLVLFPADSQGEDWRFFRPQQDGEHFVVSGGRVEEGA